MTAAWLIRIQRARREAVVRACIEAIGRESPQWRSDFYLWLAA